MVLKSVNTCYSNRQSKPSTGPILGLQSFANAHPHPLFCYCHKDLCSFSFILSSLHPYCMHTMLPTLPPTPLFSFSQQILWNSLLHMFHFQLLTCTFFSDYSTTTTVVNIKCEDCLGIYWSGESFWQRSFALSLSLSLGGYWECYELVNALWEMFKLCARRR